MSADAEPEVYPQYGAGVVVACTCKRGDEHPNGHAFDCPSSVALAFRISMTAGRGVLSGALTRSERDLLDAVSCLIKDRSGRRGGTNNNIDLHDLAHRMIRDAAAEICGEDGPS